MRRARRRFAFGCIAFVTCAIAAACTFPSVIFDSDAGRAEAGPQPDGGTDGTVTADGNLTPETEPPLDATSEKPDTGPCVDPCDCDKDTFKSKADACGGNDCDDDDPRANPSANFRSDLATKDTKGDWNCNGVPERLHGVVGANCASVALESCPSGKAGLKYDIPCGATGEYIVCKNNGLSLCVEVDGGFATQECR